MEEYTLQILMEFVKSDKTAGRWSGYGGGFSLWTWFNEDHAYLERPLGMGLEVGLEGCPHFLAFLKENQCSKKCGYMGYRRRTD